MDSEITNRKPRVALLVLAGLVASCGSSSTDNGLARSSSASANGSVLERAVPPPLTSLPKEGEAYVQPGLVGLALDDVRDWAEASSLDMTVFDNVEDIEVHTEHRSNRLTVVAESGVVTYTWIG